MTQAESAFRTEKTELNLRPIWHHLEDRVQAHILFSFLAYAMWKTLEQWMARSGLGNGPRPVLEEFDRIRPVEKRLPCRVGRTRDLGPCRPSTSGALAHREVFDPLSLIRHDQILSHFLGRHRRRPDLTGQ